MTYKQYQIRIPFFILDKIYKQPTLSQEIQELIPTEKINISYVWNDKGLIQNYNTIVSQDFEIEVEGLKIAGKKNESLQTVANRVIKNNDLSQFLWVKYGISKYLISKKNFTKTANQHQIEDAKLKNQYDLPLIEEEKILLGE